MENNIDNLINISYEIDLFILENVPRFVLITLCKLNHLELIVDTLSNVTSFLLRKKTLVLNKPISVINDNNQLSISLIIVIRPILEFKNLLYVRFFILILYTPTFADNI